jgi:hypothetical protein
MIDILILSAKSGQFTIGDGLFGRSLLRYLRRSQPDLTDGCRTLE